MAQVWQALAVGTFPRKSFWDEGFEWPNVNLANLQFYLKLNRSSLPCTIIYSTVPYKDECLF